MKTNLEVHSGSVIITSLDNNFEARIDIQSGETTFDYAEGTIDGMYRFISTARTRYRKFMASKEAEAFKFD
ncbi:hypothetical protein BH780_gp111 [Bacillus phage Eldridge]|uniref:Uncharacterized protein n=1 Tax=Bacillus phage Eldridge TaxID=1776293 RepID=A0A0Y0AAB8_9CAUD|nr:hypothetical protein BH780_gp111 [Bacillus phage Eldridge]AMB18694.1 hypothetical protein Eldridge_0114 [Bacillus phage Eldridge]